MSAPAVDALRHGEPAGGTAPQAKTEQVHCPSCGRLVTVALVANGGMFASPCKCGVSVGVVVTAFGSTR